MNKTLVVGNAPRMREGSAENTGNLVHAISARRLLLNFEDFNIGKPWTDAQIDFIRNNFSNVLFVAANTIRATSDKVFLQIQATMAENLKKLQLPVVTLGLGAQAGINDLPKDLSLHTETLDLIRVISENSNIFGVRGEYTQDVLRYNGIKNAVPMGCPSVYYHVESGAAHPHANTLKRPQIDHKSKLIFNYTSFWREFGIFKTVATVNNSYLVGQGEAFEQRLSADSTVEEIPPSTYQNVFIKNEGVERLFMNTVKKNYRKFYNLEDWLAFAKDADLSFGSRFHGNMASLIAGVPSIWFAHDSRTLELCEYHGLPNIVTGAKPLNLQLDDIVSAVDYTSFFNKYSKNRAKLKDYLDSSGITNRL
jgi:hypothetical protein